MVAQCDRRILIPRLRPATAAEYTERFERALARGATVGEFADSMPDWTFEQVAFYCGDALPTGTRGHCAMHVETAT